jgi:hypothetical protein
MCILLGRSEPLLSFLDLPDLQRAAPCDYGQEAALPSLKPFFDQR